MRVFRTKRPQHSPSRGDRTTEECRHSSATKYLDEALKGLKKVEAWIWTPLMYLRCPGCGHEGCLVNTTFEALPHKDLRAWQIVAQKLDADERFLPCPSQALHEELMAEDWRMMERKARGVEWETERSRRIAALRSGLLARSSGGEIA